MNLLSNLLTFPEDYEESIVALSFPGNIARFAVIEIHDGRTMVFQCEPEFRKYVIREYFYDSFAEKGMIFTRYGDSWHFVSGENYRLISETPNIIKLAHVEITCAMRGSAHVIRVDGILMGISSEIKRRRILFIKQTENGALQIETKNGSVQVFVVRHNKNKTYHLYAQDMINIAPTFKLHNFEETRITRRLSNSKS